MDKGLVNRINKERLPAHIAIIMDGNGRWAKEQNMPRVYGHRAGVNTVRQIVEAGVEVGLKYLTLYTFSTENWKRPKQEVSSLMNLLVVTIRKELHDLNKNNVSIGVIGDIERIPEKTKLEVLKAIELTKNNTGLKLIIALSYSARWDILRAVQSIIDESSNGTKKISSLNDEEFKKHLSTNAYPDPELLIRTSGEFRISNFLLWELAYAEFYFTNKKWPEFTKNDFFEAILDYQHRERRFGKVSEQLKS